MFTKRLGQWIQGTVLQRRTRLSCKLHMARSMPPASRLFKLESLEDRMLLATVTVDPFVATADELGPSPGIFRFTRTGDVSAPLSVNFTLGGTAARGVDYQIWENTANFAAGTNAAYVSVLPRNDSLREGNESIVLTLSPGSGYTIGTANRGTVTVVDRFVTNFRGIFDPTNSGLAQDINYLDAAVSNGQLQIAVGVTGGWSLSTLELFLDTDQNPATGDIRAGHIGGAEFRITSL